MSSDYAGGQDEVNLVVTHSYKKANMHSYEVFKRTIQSRLAILMFSGRNIKFTRTKLLSTFLAWPQWTIADSGFSPESKS